jgi:peptidoglycan biosynthesis protein MviN/MurJ (putative lipid II flippase)
LVPEVVRLLFQRGAFDSNATLTVSRITQVGLLQIPFYFGGIALVQWIGATGRYSALLLINLAALVLKVVLNLWLVPTLGLTGIMLSTAAMYFANFGFLLLLVVGSKVSIGAVANRASDSK